MIRMSSNCNVIFHLLQLTKYQQTGVKKTMTDLNTLAPNLYKCSILAIALVLGTKYED